MSEEEKQVELPVQLTKEEAESIIEELKKPVTKVGVTRRVKKLSKHREKMAKESRKRSRGKH